ncbi:hypothetical protein [Streptomyces sp. NRRL S-31]|uniref:hypothetical protein n=1 Tax=Streptomyces sp. NRRL S-31 TaxID=1463898 RepID=UPI0004C711C7|nr:hypothetical protein [Streptomyces sp. NRRL S-31]
MTQYDGICDAFEIAVGVRCLDHAEDTAAMERMCRYVHRRHRHPRVRRDFRADLLANPPLQMLRCRA